jgi:hypothetical protein
VVVGRNKYFATLLEEVFSECYLARLQRLSLYRLVN